MKYKCLNCKTAFLTEEDFTNGYCHECLNPVELDDYNFNFIVCPECGKKLEGEDLKNAYYACCPFCLTFIEEEYFDGID